MIWTLTLALLINYVLQRIHGYLLLAKIARIHKFWIFIDQRPICKFAKQIEATFLIGHLTSNLENKWH